MRKIFILSIYTIPVVLNDESDKEGKINRIIHQRGFHRAAFKHFLLFLYYPECDLITIDFPDTVEGIDAPCARMQAFFFHCGANFCFAVTTGCSSGRPEARENLFMHSSFLVSDPLKARASCTCAKAIFIYAMREAFTHNKTQTKADVTATV